MSRTKSATQTDCGHTMGENTTACCPSCGSVECLCRPRFFAGQLLSEKDLNLLDSYIKNKNRLHNLGQHGWGVVNGLKVLCDPCGDVKVTRGYAVDPCGDDIVVCEDTNVNFCDLIRKCKQSVKLPDCEPFRKPQSSQCDDLEEEWVVTIKYQEWATRGITALRGSNCSSSNCNTDNSASGCSCGGTTSCCCGTGSKAPLNSNTNFTGANRGSPPECEPTVICEGYSFGAYPKPVEDSKDDQDDKTFNLTGSFADAFNCCAQTLNATIPPMPDLTNDPDLLQLAKAISGWCCQWRINLLKYFATHPNTSCEIIDFLKAIVCPSLANPNNFLQDFIVSFLSLFAAWAEGLKICLCLALLPPTPEPTCDSRVPLATVKVRARDCKILSICNWTTERKIMVTWPAMGHWLGILSVGEFFHGLLDTLCCQSLLGLFDDIVRKYPPEDQQGNDPIPGTPDEAADSLNASSADDLNMKKETSFGEALHLFSGDLSSQFSFRGTSLKGNNFSKFINASISRGDQPLELGAVLNSVSSRFKLPTNGNDLSSVEAENIPMLLLSEILVKPVMGNILGNKEVDKQMEKFAKEYKKKSETVNKGATKSTNSSSIEQQLLDMQSQINTQEQKISTLIEQLSNKK